MICKHQSEKLTSYKYCNVSLTSVIYLDTVKQSNISFSDNSVLHQSFACTQFKCKTVQFDL